MSRSIYYSVENVNQVATVFCEVNSKGAKPMTFRNLLELMAGKDGGDLAMGSSSCDSPEEYGTLSDDTRAILAIIGGAGIIELRSNPVVQAEIKNDIAFVESVLGSELTKHIKA